MPIWLDPSSGGGTTITHTSSPLAQPPAPCRAARMAPAGCSLVCGGRGSCLHGALGSAAPLLAEQGTFGPEQGTPALGWAPCFPCL